MKIISLQVNIQRNVQNFLNQIINRNFYAHFRSAATVIVDWFNAINKQSW